MKPPETIISFLGLYIARVNVPEGMWVVSTFDSIVGYAGSLVEARRIAKNAVRL